MVYSFRGSYKVEQKWNGKANLDKVKQKLCLRHFSTSTIFVLMSYLVLARNVHSHLWSSLERERERETGELYVL